MIKKVSFSLLLTLSAISSPLDNANKELSAGNTIQALKYYKIAAAREDDEALFKLGILYYKGKYVKRDLNKAFDYFRKASNLEHEKAKYNLALLYARKGTSFHNYRLAYNNFLDLAQNSHPKAQFQVGNFLTYGFVKKDYKLAVKWYEQSLQNGYSLASCSLGYMYANGMGVFPNFGKARELVQNGVDKKIPLCLKIYNDFNLKKYDKDRGFKFGFYK